MPHKFRQILLLAGALVLSMPAHAVTDGSGWQIVQQLTTMYKTMMDSLREMKAHNETLSQVRDMYQSAQEMHDVGEHVLNSRPLDVVMRDLQNLTGLNNLGNTYSDEERLNIIMRELDRRLKETPDDPSLREAKSRIERQRALQKIEEAKLKSAASVNNKELKERQALNVLARNAELQTMLAAEAAKQASRKEMQEAITNDNADTLFKSTGDIYGGMRKDGW